MIKHGGVLPAIAVSPKPLTDACTKIFARQNTAQNRRGQAVFAARTRGQDGSFRLAEFLSCSPRYPIHDLGGFRHHGDGGKGNGHQHTARFDIKTRLVQNRNTPAGRTVLPLNRARNEKQKKPDSSRSKIYRISAVQGDGVNRLII